MDPRTKQRGFTLMEALVATTIITVLVGIAVPQYSALAVRMRTNAAVTQLASDLNFARAMSLRTLTPHYVRVLASSGVAYEVKRSAAPPVIAPATDPVVRNIDLSARMPNIVFSLNGATADPYGNAVTVATPSGTIAFDGRGLPSTGAAFFVASSNGANSAAVTLTGAGKVRIWTKTGSTWR